MAHKNLDLEELKEIAHSATPGRWYHEEDQYDPSPSIIRSEHGRRYDVILKVTANYEFGAAHISEANMTHITTFSPSTVLSLLSRLEAAEARVQELESSKENQA